MKNNLILGVQGLKKMLKGMFFVVGLFAVVLVGAKPMGAARPSDEPAQRRDTRSTGTGTSSASTTTSRASNTAARTSTVTGQTPTSTQQSQEITPEQKATADKKAAREVLVRKLLAVADITRAQLTPAGKEIVGYVEQGDDWENFWNRHVNNVQNSKEKMFFEGLRDKIQGKTEKAEKTSTVEGLVQELRADLRDERRARAEERAEFNRLLAMQKKGYLSNMYQSAVATAKSLGLAGLAGGAAYYASFSNPAIAAAATTAIGLRYGFNWLVSQAKTGGLSDAAAAVFGQNLIAQEIQNSGRYPTFNAKIEGIMKDMFNTSNMEDDLFDQYRNDVRNSVNENQPTSPTIVAEEKEIDDAIKVVQKKYFDEDELAYMRKIEQDEDIAYAQALVSEYLRAAFRSEQKELLKQTKEEQGKKAPAPEEKKKAWSVWDLNPWS